MNLTIETITLVDCIQRTVQEDWLSRVPNFLQRIQVIVNLKEHNQHSKNSLRELAKYKRTKIEQDTTSFS